MLTTSLLQSDAAVQGDVEKLEVALRAGANSQQFSQYTNGAFVAGLLATLQTLENKNFLTGLKRTIYAFEAGASAADVGVGIKRIQLDDSGGDEWSAKRSRY